MKKFLFTIVSFAALALPCPTNAHAMDIEARPPFIILSGPVTGTELRLLSDAIDSNPAINTVVLKNSGGGDARTGFLVREYIRSKGLNTVVSGYCRSSCSRMFLGGNARSISNDQPLESTYVAFHSNYASDGQRVYAAAATLKAWVTQYSGGKANPLLVDQWVNLDNRRGFAYFYHPHAAIEAGPNRVLLCKGDEDPKNRPQLCAKPDLGDAMANGILTTLEIVTMNQLKAELKP